MDLQPATIYRVPLVCLSLSTPRSDKYSRWCPLSLQKFSSFIEVMTITWVTYLAFSDAGFTELPSSVNVTAGNEAVFRCQHSDAEFIGWRVNSMSLRNTSVLGVSLGTDGSLTILALLENNGTLVECVALFTDGTLPISSPTAILIVQEKSATESEPTSASNGDFIEVPSPPVMIVSLQDRHVYICDHSETERITWTVNGSLLNDEIFPPDIIQNSIPLSGGGKVYILTIGGRPEHNATTIQCLAQLEGGSTMVTPSVTFLIQGIPENVNKLVRNGTSITWEAPFSLNLTNVEPDIVYCVEVYNITCGRSHLISDCNVMETKYSSGDLQAGYIYEYTVTPRSNVKGAMNGSSQTIRDEFVQLQLSPKGHTFSIIGDLDSDNASLRTRLHLTRDIEQPLNEVLATSYSLLLNSLDSYKENESFFMSTTVSKYGNSVMFEAFLPFRRRLNYTVLAYGCDEHPVMEATELSTHDIQNMSINSHLGEIRLTGDFITGSEAVGVLAVVLSTSDILYHLVTRESGGLHVDDTITNVVGGNHVISIFVVEENGLPVTRTASTPRVVSVRHGNAAEPSFPIDYDVQSTSTGVCINCTFLEDSATDCVAVVHQRISQLKSSGLMNIKSSHKFTRSGDTASGCIEGVNLEVCQVGVYALRSLLSITTTDPQDTGVPLIDNVTAAAVALIILVFLLAAATCTVCIVMSLVTHTRRIKQRTLTPSPENPFPKPPLIRNEYEAIAPASPTTPTEPISDNALLFQITSDGPTLQPLQEQSNDQGGSAHTTPPPVPEKGPGLPSRPPRHGRIEGDSTTMAYAETVATMLSTAPPPTAAENVVYHEVQGFQNQLGQHYTMISDLSPCRDKPDDLHKTESPYSEIKHDHSGSEVETAEKAQTSEDHSLQPEEDPVSPTPAPFTLEHLLPELMPHASKWQSLGEALSLDEDRLDEIFTNNEKDEACLEEMLELYLQRSDLNHSWEEIEAALERVKETESASDCSASQNGHETCQQESNNQDYNSTFDDEAVQHPNERCGSDGGSFESGIESKAIPVDTRIVVDDRPCPVMSNNETTFPCEEMRQSTLNFTVTNGHELHKNGMQWLSNKSQPMTEELSACTQQRLDSYCSEESHCVSDGSTISAVLVLVKESQRWSMKQSIVGRSEETITSTIVTGKSCHRRRSLKA